MSERPSQHLQEGYVPPQAAVKVVEVVVRETPAESQRGYSPVPNAVKPPSTTVTKPDPKS